MLCAMFATDDCPTSLIVQPGAALLRESPLPEAVLEEHERRLEGERS